MERNWTWDIPKVELHAHLNGSVRDSTIVELSQAAGLVGDHDLDFMLDKSQRSLEQCFQLFDLIHKVTTSPDVVSRITRECLEDFAEAGTRYIELRTTPKETASMSRRVYVETVLTAMREFESREGADRLIPRLLLSFNRRDSPEAAMQTAKLAVEYARGSGVRVVGVELSGDPRKGDFKDFIPVFDFARKNGLKTSIHFAEVENPREAHHMLDWAPERLGHAICLDDELTARVLESQIPIEICLTSNVLSNSVPSYDGHHFRSLYEEGHPLVLCTDDSGVFGTTLAREYEIAHETFALNPRRMFEMSRRAIDFIFETDAVKDTLRSRFDSFLVWLGDYEK
eukprot:Rmarinus@m.7051